MRILFVLNTLNDSRSVAGGVRHYTSLAQQWNRMGHQTDFVVARAGFPQLRRFSPHSRLFNSDPYFDATNYLSKTWLYFPAYAYRMASAHWLRVDRPYDIVYAAGQFIVEWHSALVLARRLKAKLAVKILHVLNTQRQAAGFFNRLFLGAERFSVRWINHRADKVLCLSESVARDYRALECSLGLSPRAAVVAGAGIDLTEFSSLPEVRKEYDAVFLARMHETKGVFDLPRVWKKVTAKRPEAKLVVIGEGPHRLRSQEMFHELGLQSNVTFTGAISDPEKNSFLAKSRIGLSLSYEEGWGLSVTEFLAAGLPVVGYHLPVFDELFPGQLLTVPAGDIEQFAAACVELFGDVQRQKMLSSEGRRFVQRYDIRAVAEIELRELERMIIAAKGDAGAH